MDFNAKNSLAVKVTITICLFAACSWKVFGSALGKMIISLEFKDFVSELKIKEINFLPRCYNKWINLYVTKIRFVKIEKNGNKILIFYGNRTVVPGSN